jgi:hypothetical protein
MLFNSWQAFDLQVALGPYRWHGSRPGFQGLVLVAFFIIEVIFIFFFNYVLVEIDIMLRLVVPKASSRPLRSHI